MNTSNSDAEKNINQRIANLRKVKRLTQKEFAEKLNVSDKTVSKWEQDGSTVALDDVERICEIFNLTLDYLIRGQKSPSDELALTPLPPFPPPFVDPIQTLVKKIDAIISKNKLQQYRERIFPSSSEDLLYDIAERVRKATLKDWEHINFDEDTELKSGGYRCYIYREAYVEDRRSAKKPIDEKYWAQVEESNTYFGHGDHNHISKEDKRLLECGFGIFMIDGFSDLSLQINLNALLALDNFEIYQKLVASGIPLHYDCSKTPKVTASTNYFEGLNFSKGYYEKIYTISKYDNHRSDQVKYIDYDKFHITYRELLGLTDLRFFSLLKKEELDMLLDKVDIKHDRVWEVIAALIEYGATKKKVVMGTATALGAGHWTEGEDPLGTLMLYEIAKMKINK